jgi:hypothetical protein
MLEQDIEAVYEELATGIDVAGSAMRRYSSPRSAFCWRGNWGDRERVLELIRQAMRLHGEDPAAGPAPVR